jgi:hypothetical protein
MRIERKFCISYFQQTHINLLQNFAKIQNLVNFQTLHIYVQIFDSSNLNKLRDMKFVL